MTIFKCEAEDDAVYIEAKDHLDAWEILKMHFGFIPLAMCVWTGVDAVPEGEELLPDVRG